MSTNDHRSARAIIPALGILALLAGHVVLLHRLSSSLAMPAAATVAVVLAVIVKHSGLLGTLRSRFRRSS
jgi:hypothetical protein